MQKRFLDYDNLRGSMKWKIILGIVVILVMVGLYFLGSYMGRRSLYNKYKQHHYEQRLVRLGIGMPGGDEADKLLDDWTTPIDDGVALSKEQRLYVGKYIMDEAKEWMDGVSKSAFL